MTASGARPKSPSRRMRGEGDFYKVRKLVEEVEDYVTSLECSNNLEDMLDEQALAAYADCPQKEELIRTALRRVSDPADLLRTFNAIVDCPADRMADLFEAFPHLI